MLAKCMHGPNVYSDKCACGPSVCVVQLCMLANSDQNESNFEVPLPFPHLLSPLFTDFDKFEDLSFYNMKCSCH